MASMYWRGTITGASGGYYNNTTGNSGIGTFSIPGGVKNLYLQPSASGMFFMLSAATGTTAFMSAGNGGQLEWGAGKVLNGPFLTRGENITVGIWNAAGGFISVRVFAGPSS